LHRLDLPGLPSATFPRFISNEQHGAMFLAVFDEASFGAPSGTNSPIGS
jgi:hypothetical protein